MKTSKDSPGHRLTPLTLDRLDELGRELFDEIVGGRRSSQPYFKLRDDSGALTGPFNALLHAPSVGGPLSRLGEAIRYDTDLTPREREIAILIVAAERCSGFEWYAHEQMASAVGMSASEIESLRRAGSVTFADDREEAVRELALIVVSREHLSDEQYGRLGAVLGPRSTVELVVLVGYYGLLADLLSVFAVGVPEGPDPFPATEDTHEDR